MDKYEPIKFPGFRYGPKGEAEIFEREEDVPEGWLDNPNDFKKEVVKSTKKEGENEAVASPSKDETVQASDAQSEGATTPVEPSQNSSKPETK